MVLCLFGDMLGMWCRYCVMLGVVLGVMLGVVHGVVVGVVHPALTWDLVVVAPGGAVSTGGLHPTRATSSLKYVTSNAGRPCLT